MSALWLGWMWLAACGGDDSPGDGPSSVGESASTATTADTADTDDTDDTTPTPTETSVEALLVALSNRGIDANEGHISFTAADDCCAWDTCLHINPGAEYATYALPPGPGEYIGDRNPDELGRILSWRLREDEAVIYVGPPPPGTAYTSFRTYIHDVAAVGGGRAMSFANLGDSLNQLVWDVNPDGTLIVVTTANQETLDRVRDAAAAVGWPVVSVDGIPGAIPDMGLDQAADTYHTTLRMVGLDRAVVDPWIAAPTAQVFRLTPDQPLSLGVLELGSRAPASLPPLDDDLSPLEGAIAATFPEHDAASLALEPLQPPDEGLCWAGCNRDVSYRVSTPALVTDDEILVAYGVDPASVGRVTWTAVVMHGMGNSDSAGAFGTADLAGTARSYLPGAPEGHYAVAFSRDCTDVPNCTTIPDTCPGIDPDEEARIVWRHYLDPVTGTFAPYENLGTQGILRLTPRKN